MCDFGAEPIWSLQPDGQTIGMSLDDLEIADSLRDAIRGWSRHYGRVFDPMRESSPADVSQFDAEGRRLWRALQANLGDRSTVGYFSETEGHTVW